MYFDDKVFGLLVHYYNQDFVEYKYLDFGDK